MQAPGKQIALVKGTEQIMKSDTEIKTSGSVGKPRYGHRFYRYFGKRFLDVILSGLALILLSPLLLILALLVRIKHGSPVLFTPVRPGMNEKVFRLFKFRSMSNARNSEGVLLPEKDRLTNFGKLIRKTSLDELPELLNILRGDMSVVGPRPLAIVYLGAYTGEQRERHAVRPGLTGLAQISGRNNLPWDLRMEKDLEYVRNLSFLLDCKIVIRTVLKVLKREDVAIPGGKMLDLDAHNIVKEEGKTVRMKGDTTWPEIGSSFWLEEPEKGEKRNDGHWYPGAGDDAVTFSGRAAIALALGDILKTRRIRKAYVPSYCCYSMLQPFVNLKIPYEFYNVRVDETTGKIQYDVDPKKKCDVLLIMKYFGADAEGYDEAIRQMKKNGGVVIEDVTHTLFDQKPGNSDADYHVASLRKWMPTPAGGYLAKTEGILSEKPDRESNHAVLKKLEAMTEKRAYMTGAGGSKEDFLIKFNSFEQALIQLDVKLKPDDATAEILESYDTEKMKARRRKNAEVLCQRLKEIRGLSFLNADFDPETQTPLFVPVLLAAKKRDALRRYLIENGVYCPIHWPEVTGADPGIRTSELSLVCDQRYEEKDMNAMADLIVGWCAEHMEENG